MSNYTDNTFSNDPNHVWSKIITYIPQNSHVLDIGCSSGNLGEVLINVSNCVVDGVEPDKTDASIAAPKLRKVWSFDVENSNNLYKIKSKYDVIIFADVLEHLKQPSACLRNISSMLKPNGIVVFSVPNMAHVSIRLALLKGDFSYTDTGLLDKTHLHFYNQDEVKNIFAGANMPLVKIESSYYDYPDRLIKERLKEVGLAPSKQILNILHSNDAATFQFVGYAKMSKSKKIIRTSEQKTLPRIQKDVAEFARIIDEQSKEIQALELNLDSTKSALEESLEQLQMIKSYWMYRVISRIAAIRKKRY